MPITARRSTRARPRRLIVAADAFAIAEPATAATLGPAIERVAVLIGSSERRADSGTAPLPRWAILPMKLPAMMMRIMANARIIANKHVHAEGTDGAPPA